MTSKVRTLIGAAALTLALAIAPAAAAQTGAVLSGVVYDRAGEPLPGVVLTIVDPLRPEPRVVLSDASGEYFVDSLIYGRSYGVAASHPRFQTSLVEARANEGEAPVHITLHRKQNRFARVVLYPFRALGSGLMKLIP
jgi:hypothetical protein